MTSGNSALSAAGGDGGALSSESPLEVGGARGFLGPSLVTAVLAPTAACGEAGGQHCRRGNYRPYF